MTGRGEVPASSLDDDGFGLVEVMVASVILIIIVISLSNLLVDSLSAALLSRQREAAASLASDTIENAKAIGQTALTAAPAGSGTCSAATAPVPVLTNLTFRQCYTTAVDGTTYTVTPTVAVGSAGQPDTVTVTVTWASAQHTYVTSTQIGS
jgi:Tfp pilus assembly protein PilV